MEKPSTQESTVSPASRANEQTPEEELYPRLSINSSATTNKTMPSTPQRNLVHSTLPQNQCAQHSAGQYASTPTIEQTTGNRTPIQGMDGDTPHRDEGTQMPSQEIHTITINQGTQIPSQQWEQTMTTEDHETFSHTRELLQNNPHDPPHWTQRSPIQLDHIKSHTYTQNPSSYKGTTLPPRWSI